MVIIALSMLSLRLATLNDLKFLFELRNDFLVRKNSFTKDRIEFEDHCRWLRKILSSSNHRLYIIVDERGQPIGQVRFDLRGDVAEINIALIQEARGCGFGKEAIRGSSALFLEQNLHYKILARVKEQNSISLKAFLNVGYKEEKREKGIIYLILKSDRELPPI